jgi:peptide/nickel transport system permease protein
MKVLVRGARSAGGKIGIALVVFSILLAVVGPFVAPYSHTRINFATKLKPPTTSHLFGTDAVGRDIFSRVLHGARLSLTSAVLVIVIAVSIGSIAGAIGGYCGGIADQVLMRITDVFFAFPFLVLAMAVAAALGPHFLNAVLALSIVWWPSYARLVRGLALSLKHTEYVEAARALGASTSMILFRHILPNCYGQILAKATTDFGFAVLATASLGFIGLGAQPPSPEWGAMIADGRTYILGFWWVATFPGLAIVITVLGFSLLGDAVQENLPR